jgi:hypothetical protein
MYLVNIQRQKLLYGNIAQRYPELKPVQKYTEQPRLRQVSRNVNKKSIINAINSCIISSKGDQLSTDKVLHKNFVES